MIWKIDVIDACLMVHGSWLEAHGQGRPGEAHGSWPDAAPALGTQSRAPGPALAPRGSSPGFLETQISAKSQGLKTGRSFFFRLLNLW